MAKYSVPFDAVTCSTSADIRSINTNATSTSAGASFGIYEIQIGGLAGSSNPTAIKLARAAYGTTPTPVTPVLLNPFSGAAGFTAASTWSAQPGSLGDGLVFLAFNAFGGGASWVAPPGSELIFTTIATGTALTASLRPTAGTGSVSGHILVEQL